MKKTFIKRMLATTAVLLCAGIFVSVANATVTSITSTAPSGGEFIRGNYDITWNTFSTASSTDTVSIALSSNSGGSYTELISGVIATNNIYTWDTTSKADGSAYKIRVTDGILDDTSASSFTIDNTTPVTAATPSGPAHASGWYNILTGVPTITLSCDDGAGSGCLETYYSWDGGTTVFSYSTTGAFNVPSEGVNTLTYWSEDNAVDSSGAHNVETAQTAEYKVDTVAPVVSSYLLDGASGDAYFNPSTDSVDADFTASEEVTWVSAQFQKVGDTPNYKTYLVDELYDDTDTASVTWDGSASGGTITDGAYEIEIHTKDVAGNETVEVLSPHTAIVDTVDPTIDDFSSPVSDSVHKDTSDTNTADALTFHATDTSPISCFYRINSGSNTPTNTLCSSGLTVTDDPIHGLSDGREDIEFVVVDAAGNTSTSALISFVFDNDDTLTVGSGPEDFATIQESINKSTDGDTILISPGTYDEQLNIDKDVTLTSSDVSTTIIQPTTAPAPGTFDIAFDAGSSGATLENLTLDFDNTGSRSGFGIVVSDLGGPTVENVTIQNNKIYMGLGVGASSVGEGVGIQTGKNADVDGLLITNNEFHGDPTDTGDGLTHGAEGIYINPNAGTGTITISNNTFTGHLFTGISVESQDVTVTGNSLTQTGPTISNTQGIRVNDFVGSVTYIGIDVTNNSITGFENGIRLGSSSTNASSMTVSVTENTFSGNTNDIWVRYDTVPTITNNLFSGTYGVKNISGSSVDAVHNWWGSDEGPTPDTPSLNPNGDGAKMSDDVDFIPWCTDGACSVTDTTAPTADLDNPPSDPDNDANPSFTVNTTDTAYYKYQIDGGGYVVETAVATPITLSSLTEASHTLDVLARDQAGNWQTTPTSYTWTVDTTDPDLTDLRIYSSNAKDGTLWAIEGDVITITATSSESIITPVVTIAGNPADSITGGSTEWYFTYTMQADDPEGIIVFSIDIEDPAGNQVIETITTDSSSITYDETAPAVDAGFDEEVNAEVLTHNATTSDGGSGIDFWLWTNETPGVGTVTFTTDDEEDPDISADTEGTYTLRLTVEDEAGNSAYNDIIFIWDTTNPVQLTATPSNGSAGVSTSAGTATVTFDEDVVLLDGSKILLVDDTTSSSHKGTVEVDGGDGVSAILNIDYTGLDYGTKYRINIKPNAVSDVAGNNLLNNIISYFTTEIDTIPPVVNSLSVSSITADGATLNVTTDENANCAFSSTDSAYSAMTAFDTTGGTTHTHILNGLSSSMGYDFFVRCEDTTAQMNTMTTSAHVSFTTLTPDTTGPVISNIQSTSITSSGVTITWETDDSATSLVEYGTTSEYGSTSTTDTSADNTSHSITLSGLDGGTDYHFRVISADALVNSSTSGDNTFTTVATADTTAPVITLLGQNPITITEGDTFTDPGATALDNTDGNLTSSIVTTSTVDTNTPGTYTVTYNVSDSAGNNATEETRTVVVEAAFDDTASLAVTRIDAVDTYATADGTYTNGWSWVYHITVPTNETQFKMKFSDFVSGANSIAVANNIRFYSAQSSANSDDSNAVTITSAGTYSSVITLDADLEPTTPGRQIEVTVEMKVPTGSSGGSYSASYGVNSDTSI